MALIGCLLILFSITLLVRTSNFLHCDNNFFCSRTPSRFWLAKRQIAQRLAEFHDQSKRRVLVAMNSSFFSIYEQKEFLCSDELYTGFLLHEDATEWNVSCLWTGNAMETGCAPVPTNYSVVPFTYIPPSQWRKLIRKFREDIGCSEAKINQSREIAELFICNERCIQAGIGYIPSLIMLLSFSIGFIKNCLL